MVYLDPSGRCWGPWCDDLEDLDEEIGEQIENLADEFADDPVEAYLDYQAGLAGGRSASSTTATSRPTLANTFNTPTLSDGYYDSLGVDRDQPWVLAGELSSALAPIPVGAAGSLTRGSRLCLRFANVTDELPAAAEAVNASIRTGVSAQRQARHVLGSPLYNGGGYFKDAAEAQRVLDAYHSGEATILGTTSNGNVIVRFDGVTGFNNNPGAGYLDQPTNVFMIKGTNSVSVVPYSPGG